MCGIVGFIDNRNKEEKTEILHNMMERIHHRGPNSGGTFIGKRAAIGFRRLSIIDLEGGSQPLYNETGNLVLTFNGEIYNYKEIREDLIAKGHIFKTNTDSEVIVHGYEEYGKDVVKKFRGMFGFIIWDIEKRELFGARDMFGIKPFYYMNNGDAFLYGSEIKSFIEHPSFKKELNKDALKSYMTFGYGASEETFFKGVYKLRPGHYFTWKDGQMDIERYASINFAPDTLKDMKASLKEINDIMDNSVNFHAGADVGVGSFLSGRIDSAYITKDLKPAMTFTVAYEGGDLEVIEHAKEYSKILGAENISRVITAEEFFDIMETIQYHCDEPYGDPSAVSNYCLSMLAKGHVTVVLSGEGADEVFAGYDEYLEGYKNNKPVEQWYFGHQCVFDDLEANKVLTDLYKNGTTAFEIAKKYYDEVKDLDNVSKQQYLDIVLRLPNDVLLKADKMANAHCIEGRNPFLDKEVIKVCESLPEVCKINGESTKYALRVASEEIISENLEHKPKNKFSVPFGTWLKEEKWYLKVKEFFSEEFVSEFFKTDAIIGLLDDHFKGNADNGEKIYLIYAFLVWYKVFFILDK